MRPKKILKNARQELGFQKRNIRYISRELRELRVFEYSKYLKYLRSQDI